MKMIEEVGKNSSVKFTKLLVKEVVVVVVFIFIFLSPTGISILGEESWKCLEMLGMCYWLRLFLFNFYLISI